jgi:hypothetical protein
LLERLLIDRLQRTVRREILLLDSRAGDRDFFYGPFLFRRLLSSNMAGG